MNILLLNNYGVKIKKTLSYMSYVFYPLLLGFEL